MRHIPPSQLTRHSLYHRLTRSYSFSLLLSISLFGYFWSLYLCPVIANHRRDRNDIHNRTLRYLYLATYSQHNRQTNVNGSQHSHLFSLPHTKLISDNVFTLNRFSDFQQQTSIGYCDFVAYIYIGCNIETFIRMHPMHTCRWFALKLRNFFLAFNILESSFHSLQRLRSVHGKWLFRHFMENAFV